MRTSVYKEKIQSILGQSHLISISDIKEKIPEADFSTLFRNIEQLCADGKARKIVISKDTVLYETVHEDTHDHFVCNDCGTIESFHMPKNINLANKVVVTDILVRGICNNCTK